MNHLDAVCMVTMRRFAENREPKMPVFTATVGTEKVQLRATSREEATYVMTKIARKLGLRVLAVI